MKTLIQVEECNSMKILQNKLIKTILSKKMMTKNYMKLQVLRPDKQKDKEILKAK